MSQVVIVNKQMAHSQIVVVIAFSLSFDMDVALVRHRRPLGNVCFHCRLSIAVTIICLNMLSFAFDRFHMVVCSFVRHPSLVVSYRLFSFVYVRFGVLECGSVCICFAIDCCCLYPFCPVCFCLIASLRSCAGLHRLLFGSEATVVFVGVSCGEPGGNEQMAHSQIVVAIVFS